MFETIHLYSKKGTLKKTENKKERKIEKRSIKNKRKKTVSALTTKTIFTKLMLSILLGVFVFFMGHVAWAAEGIHKKMNFQGKVVNKDGTNVTNGNYDFTFRIFDAASGGNQLWSESWTTSTSQVNVIDGIFQIELGTHNTLENVDFNDDQRYLAVEFNNDGPMSTRIHFDAVPYAFNSDKLGGLTKNDFFQIGTSTPLIDASNNPGLSLNKTSNTGPLMLLQKNGTDEFTIGNDGTVDFHGNEAVDMRIENANGSVATPTCDSATQGRMYYDTAQDGAFVCIETAPGVFGWYDFTTTTVQSNKVVTVGTGGDYATIAMAAGYLNALGGGIILLTPENHSVNSSVDLTNITLIGANTGDTKINVTGSGLMRVKETQFKSLTINVDAGISGISAIDAKFDASTTSSIIFEWVDFITNGTKVLIDSTESTKPTIRTRFISPSATAGTQKIFLPKASSNINTNSTHFVESQGGSGALNMEDWNVKIAGSSNVITSGTIETIPSSTLFVYPGMNVQAAINSLPSGGIMTLLPGVHNLSQTLLINSDDIKIQGYGEASVVRFSGIATSDIAAAVQIGAADGSHPVDGVILSNFKMEITGSGATDVHGIRVTGGEDNQLEGIALIKTSGASGTGATAHMGILMTDSTSEKLIRPVVKDCRVMGTSSTNAYFTDGIHITGGASYGAGSGIWTYGQGVDGALVDGNHVDYVRETVAVFIGVNNSSLFNNRFTRMGVSATGNPFGIFMGNSSNVNMTANVVSTSLSTATFGIVLEYLNSGSLKQLTDSAFTSNTVDGSMNGGVGFQVGVNIGNANNTGFHRNLFANNVINGASNIVTTAINVSGNADDNTFTNNIINGINNPWDTGINIAAAAAERNNLGQNAFMNTTAKIADAGTSNQLNVSQHDGTVNPTVNDDNTRGYSVGTLWVNTATQNVYVSTSVATGAAVWTQMTGGSGSGSSFVQGGNSFGTLATIGTLDNNALRFITNNQEAIRILAANQFVGIGTSTPGAQLTIRRVTSGTAFSIRNTGDTADVFTISDNGEVTAGTINGQTISSTANFTGSMTVANGLSVTSGNLTSGGGLVFSGATPAISASATNANLTIDANGTGEVRIGGISTGNILLGGGSSSTGCTLNNATGDFTCAGNILPGNTSGQQGWWSRTGTTLSPSNVGDAISTSGNISTTGTGTITAAGLVTANAGVSVGNNQSYTGSGIVSLNSGAGSALNIDSGTTGAINIGTGTNAKTITIGNTTGATAVNINTGSGDFNVNSGMIFADASSGNVGIGTTNPAAKLDVAEVISSSNKNGMNISFQEDSNAANLLSAALHVAATSSGDAGDTLYGINVDNITSTASSEIGLRIGTGWDYDLDFADSTPTMRVPTGSSFTITDGSETLFEISDLGGNFGSRIMAGAFVDKNTFVQEGFDKNRSSLANDTPGTGSSNSGMGDGGGWGVYEQTNCTFSSVPDEVNGIFRLRSNTTPNGCLSTLDEGSNDRRDIIDADNMPIFLLKFKPSATGANNNTFVGASYLTDGTSTDPTNFIGFTNNNGTTWTGRTTSGGSSTNVACTGQTMSTSNYGVGMIEVRSSTEVRFYVDNNVSDGINFQYCGTSNNNVPTVGLAPQVLYQTRAGGTSGSWLDVDFFRLWQDDDPNAVPVDQKIEDLDAEYTKQAAITQFYPADDLTMAAGTLVERDDSSSKLKVKPAEKAANLAGVVVTESGLEINQGTFDAVRVATMGRAKLKVVTENGQIKAGDYLTVSSIPGVAAKATGSGMVIGRAITSYTEEDKNKEGEVLVQINVENILFPDKDSFSSDKTTATLSLDLSVLGQLEAKKGLVVNGDAEFKGKTIFSSLAEFADKVLFKGKTQFAEKPQFNADTVGSVTMQSGTKKVEVKFSSAFDANPVVQASMSAKDGASDAEIQQLLDADIEYVITNITTNGFTIEIKQDAPVDIRFSWTALEKGATF